MFAVITAIVTIEPTAEDSIKKAFIRFPASAIGAAFAVLFTYFFGTVLFLIPWFPFSQLSPVPNLNYMMVCLSPL